MKIGILGGGQLAQMLLEAARSLKLNCRIFVQEEDTPASQLTSEVTVAPFEKDSLRSFLSQIDLCLFESEFVDVELLRHASEDLSVTFLPSLDSMEIFQDKLKQKEFCAASEIPTAPYLVCNVQDDAASFLRKIEEKFGKAVLKWAKLGYDGKGNFVYSKEVEQQKAIDFIVSAQKRQSAVYGEEFVPFDQELATIGCRSIRGEMRLYPVVQTVQQKGICLTTICPADKVGTSEEVCRQVGQIAQAIGEKGGLVGSYGVELFQIGNRVVVNEVAPRVHNTGHYTQDAGVVSQFENHLRAALGMPLGETKPIGLCVMRNILGPDGVVSQSNTAPETSGEIKLHWYGKKGIKPGRKLGHMNGVAKDIEGTKVLFQQMEDAERQWVKKLNEQK